MTRLGYLAVSVAAILWAIGGTVATHLIHQGASLVELTEARAWITTVLLGIVVLLQRDRSAPKERLNPFLFVLFGCSIAMANLTYYAALSRLPVAVAITVQYTAPGLVVLWTAVGERRAPTRRTIGALVAAMAGVALLAELPSAVREGHLRVDTLGLMTACLSALAFSVYMVSGQRLARSLGAVRTVFWGFCVASVLWAIVQATRGRPETLLHARFLPGVIFLAVATTFVPFLLFVWGLEHVRASDAGIVSTLEPLTAAVIAYVWLHQALGALQIVGGLLVLVGIGVVQAERPGVAVTPERAAID